VCRYTSRATVCWQECQAASPGVTGQADQYQLARTARSGASRNGGTDWLRRSDQADLERRDLPWLRRSRPLMLDMQMSGLRDIAAGMPVVGGSLSRLRRFGFAPRSWSRCRTACAEGGDTVAVEFVAVGHAAGHGHDQGHGAAGHHRPGAGGEGAVAGLQL
jgi:hypothetical protein